MTLFATIGLTGYLFYIMPKGFFPQQDTGMILGITEAAQDISFPAMVERQQAVVNIVLQDPAVATVGSYVGPGGSTATLNDGRMFIALKPHDQRTASADQVINRLRPRLAHLQGITLYMQAAQDITVGGRLSKTQYQYTLADADPAELSHWSAIVLDRLRTLPGIADVTSDQENAGPLLDIVIDRSAAARFGIQPSLIDNTLADAFGQRIVTQIFTALNQYHVVLEVDPPLPVRPGIAGQHLRSLADRPASAAQRRGQDDDEGGAARDQSPGAVHLGHDLLQPQARRRRSAMRSPPFTGSKRSSTSPPRSRRASRATPRPMRRRWRASPS